MASLESNLFTPDGPDSPLGKIVHSCPDTYEIDDTWQQAKDIEAGVSQIHWFDSNPVLSAADKDYVSFDLKSGQEITFTVTSTDTEVILEVYDDTGNYTGLSGTDSLKLEDLQAGQYFLSASPINQVWGCKNETGYELLAEKSVQNIVYVPIIMN